MDAAHRLTAALADRYAIESEIDSGGMATVYRARDLKHDRAVAIKVLRPDLVEAVGADRFLREIRTTANLSHPHILPLHDSGEAGGFLYYVMPFVKGESLRDRLEREGQLPLEDAVQIAREVADALAYAHRNGVIHRDIKPANIMLDEGHALLADFGIAQAKAGAQETKLTGSGMSLGTPSYMSPEQIEGAKAVDGRSDQYALACVLYEMLAGHPPFTGSDIQTVMRQHLAADAPRVTGARASVPAGVAKTLHRALAKTPADRFRTMSDFEKALAGATLPLLARIPMGRTRETILGTLAILVLLGTGYWAVTRFGSNEGAESGSAVTPPSPEDRPLTVLTALEGNVDEGHREAVTFMLETELNRNLPVQIIPGPALARMRVLMDLPDTAILNPDRARDLATRAGASTVTIPRMDEIDGAYLFSIRVEDRSSGAQRAGATGRAASMAQVPEMIQDAVWEIQAALGATPEALENTRRFPDVVTPSLEALTLYLEGRNLTWLGSPRDAIPILKEAVTLDPAFAMAWNMLGMAYNRLGIQDSARAAAAQRDRNPERLSEARAANNAFWHTLDLDVSLWDQAFEDFNRAVIRNIREGRRDFANNYALGLANISWQDSAFATLLHRHRRHVDELRREDPSRELWFVCDQIEMINSSVLAADRGEAPRYLAFMDSLNLIVDDQCLTWMDFLSAVTTGDWNRVESLYGAVQAAPDLNSNNLAYAEPMLAQMAAVRGRIGEHHRFRAERGAPDEVATLILELIYQLPPETSGEDEATLKGRDESSVVSFIHHGARSAILGDTLASAGALRRLEAMKDSATSQRFERAFEPWFVLMEAGPAYQAEDWPRLIQILEPIEARFREPGYGYQIGDTYLVWWLLAEAYEETGQTEKALARLQDVIGLPRYRFFDRNILGLSFPAAQLKLGELYRELGDATQAATHYRTFLSVFTDPEPEFQWMVEEAREGLSEVEESLSPASGVGMGAEE
jgi:serine/threonine-protein kinase